MDSSSSSSHSINLTLHYSGYFVKGSQFYCNGLVKSIQNVNFSNLDLSSLYALIESESNTLCTGVYYCLPGEDIKNGLKVILSDEDVLEFMENGLNNDGKMDIYVDHAHSDLTEYMGKDVQCEVGYEDDELNDVKLSSDEEETALVDHISEGEDELFEVRMKKMDIYVDHAHSVSLPLDPQSTCNEDPNHNPLTKCVEDPFLTHLCDGYNADRFIEHEIGSEDEKLESENEFEEHFKHPIHNPNIRWDFMKPVLGEKNESPQQLKTCLTNYGITNGYQIVLEKNDHGHILARCGQRGKGNGFPWRLWATWMTNEKTFHVKTMIDEHRCVRKYNLGRMVNSTWVAKTYATMIRQNPSIKLRDLQSVILETYKCKVTIGVCYRAKRKALAEFDKGLVEHYGKLWDYAEELKKSNPRSTVLTLMPDGKNYFKRFYVCLSGLKKAWVQGCKRVIGLDGCFLKTACKGELLSAVGRDANNKIFPFAWAVVTVENKDNWKWFMECIIGDIGFSDGRGLTIISDQHKGLLEAAKKVLPLAEHRQCARHIYQNFRKRHTGVLFKNLFWKTSKASYPEKLMQVMEEIKQADHQAYDYLMKPDPKSWNKAYFRTGMACDAVENGISECFNSLIVYARRKPIITMLEEIRIHLMERLDKMRIKADKWVDNICPSIRKKLEIQKDLHRFWYVINGGKGNFEVKHGLQAFSVNEPNKTCICRL